MLVDIVLNIIYSVIGGFLGLLPDVSFDDGVLEAVYNLSRYVNALDFVVPTATLFAIVGLFLTLNGVLLSISAVNWFIRKIPSIN